MIELFYKMESAKEKSMNLTFFEQSESQRIIAAFGRRMMWFSESGENMNVPLEILNAFSRVGEEMAETGSLKNLTKTDFLTIKYAKKILNA
jgi:hypothetical protein